MIIFRLHYKIAVVIMSAGAWTGVRMNLTFQDAVLGRLCWEADERKNLNFQNVLLGRDNVELTGVWEGTEERTSPFRMRC